MYRYYISTPAVRICTIPLFLIPSSSPCAIRVRYDSIMPLPTAGSPSFLPSLIAHLGDSRQLHGWTFDPTLLSVLLLALIVKRGGVILDVLREPHAPKSRDAVHSVVNVVSAVRPPPSPASSLCRESKLMSRRQMAESVFGRTTRHAALTPGSETADVAHGVLGDPHPQPSGRARHAKPEGGWQFPEMLVVSGLEAAPSPAQIKLVSVLHAARLELAGETYTPPEGFMAVWVRDPDGEEVPTWVVRPLALPPTHPRPVAYLLRSGGPLQLLDRHLPHRPRAAATWTHSRGPHPARRTSIHPSPLSNKTRQGEVRQG